MKQRGTRGLLFLLVLAIWGAVVARAFRKPPETATLGAQPSTPATTTIDSIPRITVFELDRDPFLGDGRSVHKPVVHHGQATPIHATVKRTETVVPPPRHRSTVQYLGYVKRKDLSGPAYVIVRVDGREQVIGVGREVAGIRVKEATPTVLVIEREGAEERLGRM